MANNTVQTNSSLAAGNYAIRSRRTQLGADGVYQMTVELVCLPSYLSTHLAALGKGSTISGVTTPTGTPKVVATDWVTQDGLSYITCQLAAVDASFSKYLTKTTSQGVRSFSATETVGDTPQTRSFDYWATTVQLQANATITYASYLSEVEPFGIHNDRGLTSISPSISYDWQPVVTLGPNGITVYSGTLTGSFSYP